MPPVRSLAIPILLGLLAAPIASAATSGDYERWLAELRAEALERGISPRTVAAALTGVELDARVLELDRSQPGAPADFCGYMVRRLTSTRIARGQRVLAERGRLLQEISEAYGVPPRYLVAIWGLETNFGDYVGDHPVIPALVTLARDPRRSKLFREQIFAALRIVDAGHQPPDGMVGSWAGAMGQVQFMPTTFLEYAVDYDGDGRKDIWGSPPDALASAANYLRRSGWRSGESWGRRVRLPSSFAPDSAALKSAKPLTAWQDEGVRQRDGGDLPDANMRGSIVLPRREADPAFLVYRNYRTFLAWNRSTFFAISLGTLADEIAGVDTHRVCEPVERTARN